MNLELNTKEERSKYFGNMAIESLTNFNLMTDKVAHVFIGIPGSGKSTQAIKLSKILGAEYLSMDSIRLEIFGDESYQDGNTRVYAIFQGRLFGNMNKGRNVIIDNTNYNRKSRKNIIEIAKKCGFNVWAHEMNTPHEISRQRNIARSRVVPDIAMERMIKGYQSPTLDEGFDRIVVVKPTNNELTYYIE